MADGRGSFEADGARIAWRRSGSGPPLVVVNGYAGTKDDWDPTFLEALGSSSTLICLDNRGVGESSVEGPERITIATMAGDVLALLDAHAIERCPVLAWSMGGFVAQELAAAAPERVEALILLGTDPGGPEARLATTGDWARLTDCSGTPREQASRVISVLFPPPVAAEIDAQFGELVAAARAQLDPAVLDAQEAAMDAWHAEPADERLAAITAPALCAAGAEDRAIPAANTLLLSDRLEGSWRALFPGGGHAFMAQFPRRLAQLVAAFLGR